MSDSSFITTAEDSSASVSADVMLKRVFSVAKLLAVVKHQRDVEDEIAENPVKNQHSSELQYREDERTTHTA
ncbi:MAG: hypothetical protein UZ13_00925 [Chloroflexi bacterium OLB13]|nr:MAG: hypothetical protein UZ13_00925 [Chloroflexi bacterium OLB13]